MQPGVGLTIGGAAHQPLTAVTARGPCCCACRRLCLMPAARQPAAEAPPRPHGA